MTPHISAKKGEIAKTVIMPGDPLRAKYIAETYLDPGFKLVSSVRNAYIFTGTYKGRPISIATSGMGITSMGIYAYELFMVYDVDRIIRTGSAGSYDANLKLYEIVVPNEAISDSGSFRRLLLGKEEKLSHPSEKLRQEIIEIAKKQGKEVKEGRVHTTDSFYSILSIPDRIAETNAVCVENEAHALFTVAEALGKDAAAIVTISENWVTHDQTSAEQRQFTFNKMMEIALDLAK
ncbi:purine-nucleoside phosphorylase [Mycoplasmopsis verecunda]|uniref:Uridine phosphorylase n=1 Tax=Mycoplasmopsis verecunda TaxID=171291 RepID=A0A1T4LFF6_9BACT|nr:purine-nucleoside phosphorylase [Mycoplasmopsis verecunda]WPB54837.1 purine-nucleoside phosphorylase [Mycoplasmopsis verecunda]SJZ53204.1 purine-nucleoside phosphorylase [Mycoplasmopsis verecunda]